MVAPMPRAAPVTRATLPSRGLSHEAGAVDESLPTATTWPETNADFAESRKRRVDSTPDRSGAASEDT